MLRRILLEEEAAIMTHWAIFHSGCRGRRIPNFEAGLGFFLFQYVYSLRLLIYEDLLPGLASPALCAVHKKPH